MKDKKKKRKVYVHCNLYIPTHLQRIRFEGQRAPSTDENPAVFTKTLIRYMRECDFVGVKIGSKICIRGMKDAWVIYKDLDSFTIEVRAELQTGYRAEFTSLRKSGWNLNGPIAEFHRLPLIGKVHKLRKLHDTGVSSFPRPTIFPCPNHSLQCIIFSTMKIKIYSTATCHYCKEAKEFFTENKLAYEEYNVGTDIAKRNEMIEKAGQLGVPVIDIDGNVFVGFDKPTIAEAVGVKA